MFQAGRGFGAQSGAIPFGSAQASYSDQPFFGKWIAVVKLLATYQVSGTDFWCSSHMFCTITLLCFCDIFSTCTT